MHHKHFSRLFTVRFVRPLLRGNKQGFNLSTAPSSRYTPCTDVALPMVSELNTVFSVSIGANQLPRGVRYPSLHGLLPAFNENAASLRWNVLRNAYPSPSQH